MSVTAENDSDLVSASLAGDREAFGQIVARYQSLVCSLAFSATGSLGQSEDLAQETFVTAWKQLAGLREPEKLRAWLCGIARNLIHNSLRRQGREPSHRAGPLEEISEAHSPEPLPVDQTISNEELAILWRSLERIPEIYREPLVLFYREHQSIEAVAANLELTEDAVKQRLSRGRKLLHEQVLAFVEGALAKTAPGKNFTLAVVASLPFAVASAKAVTVGSAIAKGGTAAKGVLTIGTFGSLFALLGGLYLTMRSQVDNTKSPRERRFLQEMIGLRAVVFLTGGAIYFWLVKHHSTNHLAQDILDAALLFLIAAVGALSSAYTQRRQQQIQIEDGTYLAAEWERPRRETELPEIASEKRSTWKIFLQCIKSMAFGLVLVGIYFHVSAHNASLSNELKRFVGPLIGMVFMVFLLVRGWWHRPRFIAPKLNWQIAFPLLMGAATLLDYNHGQYLAFAGIGAASSASLATIITFNAIVVLAYIALAGILVWLHKMKFVARQK